MVDVKFPRTYSLVPGVSDQSTGHSNKEMMLVGSYTFWYLKLPPDPKNRELITP